MQSLFDLQIDFIVRNQFVRNQMLEKFHSVIFSFSFVVFPENLWCLKLNRFAQICICKVIKSYEVGALIKMILLVYYTNSIEILF